MIAANLEDDDLENMEEEEQEEDEMPQVRRSLGGAPGAQVTSWCWRRSCCSDGFLSSPGGAGGGLPSRHEERLHGARPPEG